MTDIPTTAAEFERWFFANLEQWPTDLRDKGNRARISLNVLARNQNRLSPERLAHEAETIKAFALAYAEQITR